MKFSLFAITVMMLAGAVALTQRDARASEPDLVWPFQPGRDWIVCRGYQWASHSNDFAFDLIVLGDGPVNTGCPWSTRQSDTDNNGINDNLTRGQEVVAPATGEVVSATTPYICVNIDDSSKSYALIHVDVNSRIADGKRVIGGQTIVGTVQDQKPGGYPGNNDVSHLHFALFGEKGCRSPKPFAASEGGLNIDGRAFPDKPGMSQGVKYSDKGGDYIKTVVARSTNPSPTGPSHVDVALIIDSSGSMGWNDPTDERKQAADRFITAAPDGDSITVVDFDDAARVVGTLASIPAGRDKLRASLNMIDSSGGTNIGAGIALACAQLKASPSSAPKAAVLLTDGLSVYSNQHECFVEKGWPIYTIGLSSSVNKVLLQRIADETHGEYRPLNEAKDLEGVYVTIRSRLSGQSPVTDTRTNVLPGSTAYLASAVPSGLAQMTWLSTWPGSTVDMTLVAPSGRTITCNTSTPDVRCDQGSTHEMIIVARPEAGIWRVELFGTDVAAGGEMTSLLATGIAADDDHVRNATIRPTRTPLFTRQPTPTPKVTHQSAINQPGATVRPTRTPVPLPVR